jgi:hypothetical protein
MTLRLNGSTSGFTEIDAPAVAGSNTITLPTGAGSANQILRNGATAGSLEFTDKIVSGTAVASTSGTSIDFTGIPSWVKRVTVMFSGVSLSGTSPVLIQIGSGSIVTTGYASAGAYTGASTGSVTSTTGYVIIPAAGNIFFHTGHVVLIHMGSNIWASSSVLGRDDGYVSSGGGTKTLSGTLDRVRITATNGSDTFDAGSINILVE